MSKSHLKFSELPKDYAGLCKLLLPRPIRRMRDYSTVLRVADALAGPHKLSKDQDDYFYLLCLLIEDYEREMLPDRLVQEALAQTAKPTSKKDFNKQMDRVFREITAKGKRVNRPKK